MLRCTIPALLGLIAFLASGPALGEGALSPEEQKIQAQVSQHTDEAEALLARVVNINSGTLNQAGVRQVGDIFRAELDALGFETRWVSMPEAVHRAGHLVAERRGTQGKRLLLIGHLDTVFEPTSAFQRFERVGDRARGPGVADMKGGDVVIVHALKALRDAGALEGTTITVVLTGDEEKVGDPVDIARADLIEAAKRSDVALGFEGSVAPDKATVARRGSSSWILTVQGQSGHSSRIFREHGSGAIFETSRILYQFYRSVRGPRYLSFNPGVIVGGTDVEYDPEAARGSAYGKTNVVAQRVIVHGGLRFISERQKEQSRGKMRRIVARSLPQTSAQIEFIDGYPAMPPTPGNRRLLKLLDKVSREAGHGPITALDPNERGAADISFVASQVDSLGGLGPVGKRAHSEEEELDLRSLPVATTRAALLIYRLTRPSNQ